MSTRYFSGNSAVDFLYISVPHAWGIVRNKTSSLVRCIPNALGVYGLDSAVLDIATGLVKAGHYTSRMFFRSYVDRRDVSFREVMHIGGRLPVIEARVFSAPVPACVAGNPLSSGPALCLCLCCRRRASIEDIHTGVSISGLFDSSSARSWLRRLKTGPGRPLPIFLPSYSTTGRILRKVPKTRISAAS